MTIQQVQKCDSVLRLLKKKAKTLHKLYENACNYELSKAQETRINTLQKEVEDLAKQLGLQAYHQTDPRGCSVYLIDETMNNTNYSQGVAIY